MIATSDNKGQYEARLIYEASENLTTLLERAGLTQAMTAAEAQVNRYHLAHVAAGRRNVSGAYAARIASVYAARVGVTQDEALARLFVPLRERKNTTVQPRGAAGRFIRAEDGADQ